MFWVYENWRARGHGAKIHRAECGFCNNGRGITTGTRPDNGKWHGSFETFEKAREFAKATCAIVSNCQKCI